VGKVTTLLGRNGVGKTPLLKCLMGLVPAKNGTIEFEGRDITTLPAHARVCAGIGYVPQGREIFPRLTVEENLLMGMASLPGNSKLPERIFELFPVLKSMLKRRGGDLSCGQQQQLAIGRALALNPRLLVEQYNDLARALADQYLVMERGEIIKRGAGADMEKDGVRELLAV